MISPSIAFGINTLISILKFTFRVPNILWDPSKNDDLILLWCHTSVSLRAIYIRAANILGSAITPRNMQSTAKWNAFEPWFPLLKEVSECQNSTRQLLLSGSNYLIPLLNFFGTWKHDRRAWGTPLMVCIESQTIAILDSKMNTFTIADINSKYFSWSKVTPWAYLWDLYT